MKKSRARSFLAIEFASSGVKLVKILQAENRFQLIHARFVPVSVAQDSQKQTALWRTAAKQVLAGEDVAKEAVLLVLNTTQTCFARAIIPKLSQKEIEGTLKWKMKDQLAFPLEQAVLDYRLQEAEQVGKEPLFSSVVSAVPRPVFDRYAQVLFGLGCRDVILVPTVFSISRFSNTFAQGKSSLVAVIDMGHSITEIALYRAGQLRFLRKIAFGGEAVTTALAQPLVLDRGTVSLTYEEADSVKRTEDLLEPVGERLVASKVEASQLHALIRPELERFVHELKRSFRCYTEEEGEVVERVLLTGGTSQLRGICEYLGEKLEIQTSPIQLETDLDITEQAETKDLSSFYRLIAAVFDHPCAPPSFQGTVTRGIKRFVGKLSYQAAAIVCAVFLAAVGGMLDWNYRRIIQASRALQAQVDNLKPGYEAAQNIRLLERKIERAHTLSSAILEKEPLWSELFKELSHSFPPEAVLEQVRYGEGALVIEGRIEGSEGRTSVSDLALAMEWPIFKSINIVKTEQREGATHFEIRCLLS